MTKRLILIIALITFLALITVWQKIQTIRFGYTIPESTQVKEQLLRQNTFLTIQLSRLKSPDYLVAQAKTTELTLLYPTTPTGILDQKSVFNKPELVNHHQLAQKP